MRTVGYRLNQPSSASSEVPSEDGRVAGLHADGFPRLSKLRRVLKAYRREPQSDGVERWVIRFVGHVWQISDQGDPNTQRTTVQCFSPLKLALEKRLVRGAFGSEPTYSTTFTNTDSAQIVKTLLDRTNSAAPTGITTAGVFELMPARSAAWENAKMQTAFQDMIQSTPDFDIVETFLDQTDGIFAKLGVENH